MAARPIKLIDPWIKLGVDDPVGPPITEAVDMKCFAKGVHLMGEEDDALVTFCDPLGYSWSLTLDLLMSIGPDSCDEALQSLGGPGTVVPFEFAYTNDPASPTNPHWSGTVMLVAYPIVDAQVNEPTEFELEMDVIGEIMRDDGGGAMAISGNHTHTVPPTPTPEPETVAA
ncbi:MAG: hypothetical protein ABW007_02885 [Chitinophagaceae bacterium]